MVECQGLTGFFLLTKFLLHYTEHKDKSISLSVKKVTIRITHLMFAIAKKLILW